ncbi:MAG: 3-oxoadipyl-CoA thiolase [Porticoccaceae bacterium]
MREVYLCDGIRTPIGRFGGGLASVRADDLAALPLRELMRRNRSVQWDQLDEVCLGCANQAGEDNRNVARMASLLAGLPESVPAVTVNRLCASGLEAIGYAFRMIATGEADLVLAGGVESMTRAPLVMGKSDQAYSRAQQVQDTTIGWRFINPAFKAEFGVHSMPETADNVARQFMVSRADQDAFALRSQQRAARADAEGFFARETMAVTVADGKKNVLFARDEHPRPRTTIDSLAALAPLNGPEGTVTAGNAAGLNDGACAVILASEDALGTHGLQPRARVLGMASAGVEPRIMGIGPVHAVSRLLGRLKMDISDFDLLEINEAFSAQVLVCLRGMGLPDDCPWVNPNGGAIALGHPLGMSGARLALTAAHTLQQTNGKYALATLCVGVGQGLALALERV